MLHKDINGFGIPTLFYESVKSLRYPLATMPKFANTFNLYLRIYYYLRQNYTLKTLNKVLFVTW